MNEADRHELVAAASAARRQAYARYSGFPVGAALRAASGRLFLGANLENASFGLTQCAERVAIGSAVVAGETRFKALAIASTGGVAPCGACRQVLAEFCEDLLILLVDVERGDYFVETRLGDLYPGKFAFRSPP